MKRVGVIRGGTGKNYVSSLKRGGEIILYINENLGEKYKVFDVLIDREGNWHVNGTPISPADLIHKVDMVWNTAEPSILITLKNLSIPNIGRNSFSSAMEESKDMLREHMARIGVPMPRSIILSAYQPDFDGPRERYSIKKAKEIHEKFAAPWIVKSLTEEKSMAIHLAKTFNELVSAIEDGVKHDKSILVEEFIAGKIASLHSVAGFRGQDIYTFPLGNTFGTFSTEEKEKLTDLVTLIYDHIDAKHYLKSDFILTPRGKVYLLQIETHPDLKNDSHFSQVSELAGAKMHDIIEHILERAL